MAVGPRVKRSSISVAWRRRRYDDRYDRYDPSDPYDRPPPRWGRPRRYYQPAPGGTCLRDACLLETGCCIGEGLDGNCMILMLLSAPSLITTLVGRGSYRASVTPMSSRLAERLIGAIGVYQREISARRPPSCRFEPTCSAYGVQALRTHGTTRGSILTLRRLLRCRPAGRRGHDPVPGVARPDPSRRLR
jgi:putative membrane protein insertion efficiency factor